MVLAPLVGIILGNPTTGLLLGAELEALFLGSVTIGTYIAPDAGISSILATAFAIHAGMDTQAALLLAVPIAVLATSLQNVLWAGYSFTSKIADDYAAKGDEKGVYRVMWFEGILNALLKFLMVFLAWIYGSDSVVAIINKIPAVILNGMATAGGVLPAIGLAMLASTMMNKNNVIYLLLGYIGAAYLKLPTIALALIGIIIVVVKFDFSDFKNVLTESSVAGKEVDDNEF
ncbi:MAG TPA: PTS sugar transporter subunit IIC [Erysipelotrichaceae bacterium]|nr:PTS sugar transporter subunit IIC [Erysipelotrichaceae bacterium]HQA85418.1 PTS sugar transporter subunit IIC [Erysipelotrichaceae bacterium]